MALMDASTNLGMLIGTALGTRILKYFGYVALFGATLGLVVFSIIYTCVFLKNPANLMRTEIRSAFEEEKEKNALKCDKGIKYEIVLLKKTSSPTFILLISPKINFFFYF